MSQMPGKSSLGGRVSSKPLGYVFLYWFVVDGGDPDVQLSERVCILVMILNG